MSGRRSQLAQATLASIVFVYCVLGFAYAVETPKWQTPDEPAHYNYVVYLAENYRFPVLQMGDCPQEYLTELKAAKFPPEMSIEPIRYEYHQPPLYYVMAATIYRITTPLGFDIQFLALRLLSVLLGAMLLVVAYSVVREIFPQDLFLALTTAAVIATVPMFIAISAAINNDTLADLILALVLLLCLKEIKVGLSQRQALALGLLIALGLLAKTTIYAPMLLSTLVALAIGERERGWHGFLRRLGTVYGLGVLLSCWWFVRNALTYGGLDLFGWQRHASVTAGQTTTAQWIAKNGLFSTIRHFVVTSCRSFWAQFGWMGVFIDSRLYTLLALVSVAMALGFALWLWRIARNRATVTNFQWWALLVLLLVFLSVLAEHIYYNLQFVQPQGRYLFPALVPIGLAFALGISEWVHMATRLLAPLAIPDRVRASLPALLQSATLVVYSLAFVLLDLGCLYLFIIPQLRG
jgi:4-amino-4-deoxy-L-arabinose transferase-like glycosyltransferase